MSVFPQGNAPFVGPQVWEGLLKWQRKGERGKQGEREWGSEIYCERKGEREGRKEKGGQWMKNTESVFDDLDHYFYFLAILL